MKMLNAKPIKQVLLQRWLAAFFLLAWVGTQTLSAQGNGETNAFAAGARLFNDHFYGTAEKAFADFAATYTNSSMRSSAILFQARARLNQTNIAGAIELLQKEKPDDSESVTPEFQFWLGEALFKKGEFKAAADSYAALNKSFPKSSFRLNAAENEAAAYAQLTNWAKVVALLGGTNGSFQSAVKEDPKNPLAMPGWLLLGKALYEQKQYAAGEQVVGGMATELMSAADKWRRLYLLTRLQLAGGKSNEALANTTNLMTLAPGSPESANSRFLQGEAFEKLGQWENAIQSYTNDLAKDFPVEVQREALARTMELRLQHSLIPDAIQQLENFIGQNPGGSSLDLAYLTLGELYLKVGNITPPISDATNYSQLAVSNLDRVIQDFPQSPLQGRARLDLGWCAWQEKKYAGAKTNFMEAIKRLPESEDQAVARFKLADALFYEGDYAGAATNYNLIWHLYGQREDLKNGLLKNLALFDQALFQAEQANLARGDQQAAAEAMGRIIAWYPDSYFSDRSMLVIGEAAGHQGDLEKARQTFSDLIQKFPRTPLAPEVEFAQARTYAMARDWKSALAVYDRWVTNHAQHPLLPQVEYARALATWKSGAETNALILFTNFVARFPDMTNLASLAQNWIGDYYFYHEDYQQADIAYQEVFGKYPTAGELPFQARLMAGRAAYARQGPNDYAAARERFTKLVSDTNVPPALMAESYFALGDTIFMQFLGEPTNTSYLVEAINSLRRITNGASTNTLAAQALGRMGDYYFTWADTLKLPPSAYTNASQAYEAVLLLPDVEVATWSQAQVGLGLVAERRGRTDEALAHYAQVLEVRRPCDPFWVKEAGANAARLREAAGQWPEAKLIYQRVAEVVPSLGPAMKKKMDTANANASKPPETAAPVKSAP